MLLLWNGANVGCCDLIGKIYGLTQMVLLHVRIFIFDLHSIILLQYLFQIKTMSLVIKQWGDCANNCKIYVYELYNACGNPYFLWLGKTLLLLWHSKFWLLQCLDNVWENWAKNLWLLNLIWYVEVIINAVSKSAMVIYVLQEHIEKLIILLNGIISAM